VRKVVKGGGVVIAGTDSPISPYALLYHTELEIFQQSGLTPFEVLQTRRCARPKPWARGANLGSSRTGKLADLAIVTDDPLADIKNARKVRTVIKNGEVHTSNLLKQAVGSGRKPGVFRRVLADDDVHGRTVHLDDSHFT
jgi:imidazolonepropionase-like amidohydrolase